MPLLKSVVENLDDVAEELRGYYTEKTDGDKTTYVLNLSDDVTGHPKVTALQNAHERQKQTNAELKTKVSELEAKAVELPEGFSADEWDRLKAFEAEVKERGEDDPDKKKQHEAEIQSVKKMYDDKIERLKTQMENGFRERDGKLKGKDSTIERLVVRDGLAAELAKNGVKKDAIPYVQAKLEKSVKVVDIDGELNAMFETDLGDKPLGEFIAEWVQTDAAKLFVEAPKGGGAPGSGDRSDNGTNPWSHKSWNATVQGRVFVSDKAKAERLAKAAGHKAAIGARRENASDFSK